MSSELVLQKDTTLDEWESYIRKAEAASAMLEYGKRWFEFQQWCKKEFGKQGGSRYTEFAQERFGMDKSLSSRWSIIGMHYEELSIIDRKFSPDYNAIYDYIRLPKELKQKLLASLKPEEKIDRKRIKELTYGHSEGDEWYTPKWIFDSLGLQFSIDVCGPVDRTFITTPADKFFTEEDDGLFQDWYGTIWCNPPYSDPEPWAIKCIQHKNGLLLSHIPMNAAWCMDVWETCDAIRLFQAIEFVRPDGKKQRPGNWLQLVAWGDTAKEALSQLQAPPDIAENPRRIPSPMWIRA